MLELGDLILRTLYEESGGQIQKAQDPLEVFSRRFPKIPAADLAAQLTAMAAEGLLTLKARSGATLTNDGLRKLGELLAQGRASGERARQVLYEELASRPSAPAAPGSSEDELDLDQIISLLRHPPSSPSPSHPAPLADDLISEDMIPEPEVDLSAYETERPPSMPLPGPATPSVRVGGAAALAAGMSTVPPSSDDATQPAYLPQMSSPPPRNLDFDDDEAEVTRLEDPFATPPVVDLAAAHAAAGIPFRPSEAPDGIAPWDERTETDGAPESESETVPPAPRASFPSASTSPAPRIRRLGEELKNLRRDLDACTSLPIDLWTEALEICRKMQAENARLEEIVMRADAAEPVAAR